ncbi:MAG: hypothetical protein ACRDNK_10175 [Solirubrobacteraceae bacterium]
MSNERTAGTIAKPLTSETEKNLWTGGALLSGPTGDAYRGTLRSEVWADGFVCVSMTDPRLIGPALAILKGSQPVTRTTRELPGHPMMMHRPTQPFLGRVIVEFWTGSSPRVAAIGSDSGRLIALTEQSLKQLA